MIERCVVLYLSIWIFIKFQNVLTEEIIPSGFGKYSMIMLELTSCKGQKFANETLISSCQLLNDEVNGSTVKTDFCVFKKIGPVQLKLRTYVWNNGRFSNIATLIFPNICKEKFVRPMKKFIKFDRDCALQQGNFTSLTDVNEVSHEMFGESNLYGKFRVQLFFSAVNTAVLCFNAVTMAVPLNHTRTYV